MSTGASAWRACSSARVAEPAHPAKLAPHDSIAGTDYARPEPGDVCRTCKRRGSGMIGATRGGHFDRIGQEPA
jgi:hypothetical protein